MKKFLRITLTIIGILVLILGGYMSALESRVQKGLDQMNHALINYSKIRDIGELPFAPKYFLEYNLSLAAFRRKDNLFAINSLNRIINETRDKEIKFSSYLLLAHIYSDSVSDNQKDNQDIAMEFAMSMCINALKLKPDDYHTKHLLERLLIQHPIEGKKVKQNELKQRLPRDDNVKVWSIIPKGDQY